MRYGALDMVDPIWLDAPPDAPEPPEDYLGLLADFRAALREILGPDLGSLCIYGAAVFPRPASWRLDVDYQVLLARGPSDGQRSSLRDLHSRLARDWPLGDELDGHYLLLEDARRRLRPSCRVWGCMDDAWALHRAHILAGRVLLLDGVDPRETLPAPDWAEFSIDLGAQLDWIRGQPQYPAYGILNSCRVLRSVRERGVVHSKADSAEWGTAELPEWREAIDAAVREYTGEAEQDDAELLEGAFPGFFEFVRSETGLG